MKKLTFLVTVLTFSSAMAGPWCHVSNSGMWSCWYYSLSQCQQRVESIGGMCTPNPQRDHWIVEDAQE